MGLVVPCPQISRVTRYGLQLAVDQVGVVLLYRCVGKCVSSDPVPLVRQVGGRIELDTAAALLAKLDREAGVIGIGCDDVGQIDLIDGGRPLYPMIRRIEFESRFEQAP